MVDISQSDKLIETKRYGERAKRLLEHFESYDAIRLPVYLLPPYELYFNLIAKYINAGDEVLELGAGTGDYSAFPLKIGARLVANDISLESLKFIKKRFNNNELLTTALFDMESIPFDDKAFDHVLCAGSLAYGDWNKVCNEVYRVLKPGGHFILVDVYNHNPIYRVNRFIHWLKGNRTKSVVNRAPSIKLIELYQSKFQLDIYYYGSFIYLAPLISKVVGEQRVRRLIEITDKIINVKKSAFRIVFVAKKE